MERDSPAGFPSFADLLSFFVARCLEKGASKRTSREPSANLAPAPCGGSADLPGNIGAEPMARAGVAISSPTLFQMITKQLSKTILLWRQQDRVNDKFSVVNSPRETSAPRRIPGPQDVRTPGPRALPGRSWVRCPETVFSAESARRPAACPCATGDHAPPAPAREEKREPKRLPVDKNYDVLAVTFSGNERRPRGP